jgi:tRNA C32,U32 (ribose-2'-O)-methylase TrmJ
MPGDVRSLNLANAVSVVLYEGLRTLDIEPPELPGAVEDAVGVTATDAPVKRKASRRGGRGRSKKAAG